MFQQDNREIFHDWQENKQVNAVSADSSQNLAKGASYQLFWHGLAPGVNVEVSSVFAHSFLVPRKISVDLDIFLDYFDFQVGQP
ncbi:MAG: hypothetical protein WCC95_01775 [Candidatus Sulfotelmatobacter sp.]